MPQCEFCGNLILLWIMLVLLRRYIIGGVYVLFKGSGLCNHCLLVSFLFRDVELLALVYSAADTVILMH